MSKIEPRYIMRECHQWEQKNTGKHISCFTMDTAKSVRMITGEFHPDDDDNSTLYVRILLDDQWRFFPHRRAPEGSDWEKDGDDSVKNPVEAILKARTNTAIRAFRSDGWYTTSNVTPEQVNIYEFSFSLPYYGTWVRTDTS